MSISLTDLEKTINSQLTTALKKSEISFNQLFIEINPEDLISEILLIFSIVFIIFFDLFNKSILYSGIINFVSDNISTLN